MLRHEIYVDGSIQQDLGFALAPLEELHAVWFLPAPSLNLPGIANELSLLHFDEVNHEVAFRFGPQEVIRLSEDSPMDIHWVTEDQKHLYLRFQLRTVEAGESVYKEGYSLKAEEVFSQEEEGKNENARHCYDLPLRSGESLYLEALKQYLFVYGIYPGRDMVVVKCGAFPGLGKSYEVTEEHPSGFKYRNTGGAYENFYDEYQELVLTLVREGNNQDKE